MLHTVEIPLNFPVSLGAGQTDYLVEAAKTVQSQWDYLMKRATFQAEKHCKKGSFVLFLKGIGCHDSNFSVLFGIRHKFAWED